MKILPVILIIVSLFLNTFFTIGGTKGKRETTEGRVPELYFPANSILAIYDGISGNKPSKDLFVKCMKGLWHLKKRGLQHFNQKIVTIIDFRLSSNKKRLWVIDIDNSKVLFHTLVAHGKNSGNEYARSFSNIPSSHQSSLGFYLTGGTYYGKHGLSLYLNGLENGVNDKARERLVVMHGAAYVSTEFIKMYGILGRSFGCPSVPIDVHKEIINTIKDESLLFIYYPDAEYENSSELLAMQLLNNLSLK